MQRPVAGTGERVVTVTQLARRLQGVLEESLGSFWVVGELSNFKVHASGHSYFTLKDDRAQIAAVMFRSACARLRFRPGDGLQVIAFGRVAFYDARGALQLYVETLEPRGQGALRLQLDALRKKLAAEGLLDPARKRPLPYLPRAIGIVTAPGGAALRDVLEMLRARFPNVRVVVRPVRVQGIGAELEIAAGIRELQAVPELDVMIVGRGGGSIEDLWAFNDEGIARAIVASRVPVVSAVGHEIDVTIADLVADVRAPTPTAAAELVIPRKTELEDELRSRLRALVGCFRRSIAASRRSLEALRARLRDPRRDLVAARSRADVLERRLVLGFARRIAVDRLRVRNSADRLRKSSPGRLLEERRGRLERAGERLSAAVVRRAEVARGQVATIGAALSGLSPLAVLERGYSVVWRSGERRAVRSATEVAVGENVVIRLHRGTVGALVTSRRSDDGDA